MSNRTFLIMLAIALTASGTGPLSAHDDGLTCHSHPSSLDAAGLEVVVAAATTETAIPHAALFHGFEIVLENVGSQYTPEDVAAARRGLSEFDELVEIVRLLVLRAERTSDPREADAALELAETTFFSLPLSDHVAFESFLAENRRGPNVVVHVEAITSYLVADALVTGELAAEVERSAQSC